MLLSAISPSLFLKLLATLLYAVLWSKSRRRTKSSSFVPKLSERVDKVSHSQAAKLAQKVSQAIIYVYFSQANLKVFYINTKNNRTREQNPA